MENDYEIGYGKPPVHTRFVKGKSGNPKGRPRKYFLGLPSQQRSHIKDDMVRLLQLKIHSAEGGRTKRITIQRAQIRGLVNRAIDGHIPSIKQLWILIRRLGLDQEPCDITVENLWRITEGTQRVLDRRYRLRDTQDPDAALDDDERPPKRANVSPERANILDDLLLELQESVTITERGKQKRITKQEALLRSLLVNSIADVSAFKLFRAIFQHYELDPQPKKYPHLGRGELHERLLELARSIEREQAPEAPALG
jgi:hypothetical protein